MLLAVTPVLHDNTPVHPLAVSFALAPSQQINLSELITGAAGLVPVLIITTLLAPLTPQIFSQTALYVPELITVMLLPVAFVLHFTVPLQPVAVKVAVKVAVSVLHKLFLLLLITGDAGLVPVRITITFDELLLPQLLLQVAV